MNIIAIDPSLNCTAVVINGSPHVFTFSNMVYNKKGDYKIWFDRFSDVVSYHTLEPMDKNCDYSALEMQKLVQHVAMACGIASIIEDTIDLTEETLIGIEGYSYSSKTNAVLDLVAFGTILRKQLSELNGVRLEIIPPLQVKQKACIMAYGQEVNKKGKPLPCRNPDGLAGSKFKKQNMLTTLLDVGKLANYEYVNKVKEYKNDIQNMANVPKPIEDVNDAFLIYGILQELLNTPELLEYNP